MQVRIRVHSSPILTCILFVPESDVAVYNMCAYMYACDGDGLIIHALHVALELIAAPHVAVIVL